MLCNNKVNLSHFEYIALHVMISTLLHQWAGYVCGGLAEAVSFVFF